MGQDETHEFEGGADSDSVSSTPPMHVVPPSGTDRMYSYMGEIPSLPLAGLVHALTVDVSQPESCWRRRDLRALPMVSSHNKVHLMALKYSLRPMTVTWL